MEYVVRILFSVLATAPFVLLASWATNRKTPWWALLFLGLMFFDLVLTGLPTLLPVDFPGAMNWTGKALSLAWPVVFLFYSSTFDRENVGLTFQQREGSFLPAVLFTVFLIVLGFILSSTLVDGGSTDAETVAFQATMPGLTEELVFRGLFLAILDRIYAPNTSFLGAPVGWGVLITSVAFGFGHGIGLDGWTPTFSAIPFVATFVSSLFLAWLKERTGSLAFPVIAHNGGNLAIMLAA